LGELVRVHDARFFLSKATIQARQDSRLDSLAPEHVVRNPVPYQLFGQHAISVKAQIAGRNFFRSRCAPIVTASFSTPPISSE